MDPKNKPGHPYHCSVCGKGLSAYHAYVRNWVVYCKEHEPPVHPSPDRKESPNEPQ